MAHGGFSKAAQVHGFTTAFSVSVGIMLLALVSVAVLIRRPPAATGIATGHDHVVELEPALVGV